MYLHLHLKGEHLKRSLHVKIFKNALLGFCPQKEGRKVVTLDQTVKFCKEETTETCCRNTHKTWQDKAVIDNEFTNFSRT